MPSIVAIGIAKAENLYNLHEIQLIGQQWLVGQPDKQELFARLTRSAGVSERTFSISADQILALKGLSSRQAIFEEFAPQLGVTAIQSAIAGSGFDSSKIDTLVFTSCSCPSIPAVDGLILDRLEWPRTTARVPIYQHGCAGGVVGLGLASKLCGPETAVMLTSVELCSLVFNVTTPSSAELVGSAIFADGAAAAIVSNEERGLTFRATQSYLIPESRHLMGYEQSDSGVHLRLDRSLPSILSKVVPERVSQFLNQNGLKVEDINYWLFHPGGVKILDSLERLFELKVEQVCWSRNVLKASGNMSSATILYVTKHFLDSNVCKSGEHVLMVGIGPGLTLELILFEYI